MSLAIYAAPFDDYNNDLINHKKNHNKTKRSNIAKLNDNKVTNMLNVIQNNETYEDDQFGDFHPPPKPESIGVEKSKENEAIIFANSNLPTPIDSEDNMNTSSYASSRTSNNTLDDYYKIQQPSSSNSDINQNNNTPNENLIKKLNYMINLLEDQQDERTTHITEEVIMYSFLGIFIIFIVDSFVRIGKYTR